MAYLGLSCFGGCCIVKECWVKLRYTVRCVGVGGYLEVYFEAGLGLFKGFYKVKVGKGS